MTTGLVALAATALLGMPATAQTATATAPWRGFLGCWSASPAVVGSEPAAPVVCVTPGASADAVTFTTIADGKVVSARTVDASGRALPLDAKGCTGTETGRWSADGRRVYLNATATCDGVQRSTSGVLALTETGDLLDVQGITADGAEQVRVARYRDVGVRGTVPPEIAVALQGTDLSVQTARVALAAPAGTSAVVETARAVGVAVTEAFVLERGQPFQLDAKQLVALVDAGLSTRITDAMIAVSNPKEFAVARPAPRNPADSVAGRRIYLTLDRYSPWGWGYTGYSAFGRYDPYGRYAYGAFAPGYGYPGYGYGAPVVIVRGEAPATPHGRMVKGRGYERPDGEPTGRTASPRPTRAEPSTSTSTGSAAPSSGSSSSSSSSSSGSSERTAKPRP